MIPAVQRLYWLSVTVAQATELSKTASEAMARRPRTSRRGMRNLHLDGLLLSMPSRGRLRSRRRSEFSACHANEFHQGRTGAGGGAAAARAKAVSWAPLYRHLS